MLNGIMTAISVLTILGGVYIVAEAFMSDSTFMRTHKRTDELWVSACNGIARCLGVKPDQPSLSAYERDCKKYADTLPAFSEETKRIMQREGHWPEPRRGFFGNQAIVNNIVRSQHGIWSESPHYGPKAPGLMRVWPNGYPPSTAGFQGSDTLRNSPYAPRIVCEVVEVEEIEIMSKGSAEVKVEGFERRYYEPIEEPDISRILLDKT